MKSKICNLAGLGLDYNPETNTLTLPKGDDFTIFPTKAAAQDVVNSQQRPGDYQIRKALIDEN